MEVRITLWSQFVLYTRRLRGIARTTTHSCIKHQHMTAIITATRISVLIVYVYRAAGNNDKVQEKTQINSSYLKKATTCHSVFIFSLTTNLKSNLFVLIYQQLWCN